MSRLASIGPMMHRACHRFAIRVNAILGSDAAMKSTAQSSRCIEMASACKGLAEICFGYGSFSSQRPLIELHYSD